MRVRQGVLSFDAFWSGGFPKKVKGKRILEVGSGNGLNACFLAYFGGEVSAMDISSGSANRIEKLNKYLDLDIKTDSGDLRILNYESGAFDLVVGKSIIHHLTHEIEEGYFLKIAQVLRQDGEVRFVEPAHNRPILRGIRLIFPQGDRPSILNAKKYAEYKKNDRHPIRDNSSKHYIKLGKKYFKHVEIIPYGAEKRLIGLLPRRIRTKKRIMKIEKLVSFFPDWLLFKLAKFQIIIYRSPKELKD